MSIVKIAAGAVASVAFAAPAIAGQYVNIESNSGFSAGDYDSTLIETHYGYTGELGEAGTWYIQGGPAFDLQDGEDGESKVSGKLGASVDLTDSLEGYGEVSVLSGTDWDLSESGVGVKAGLTYSF